MSKKWIAAISIYLGLLAVCIVALYAVPSVKGILERTYIAEHGELDVTDEVSAFIVRDEHVFVAKQSSKINRFSEEGELVKAASAIVELTPIEGNDSTAESGSFDDIVEELGDNVRETEKGYSSEAGYVSYHVDGAEGKLTTARMGELTKKEYESLTDKRSRQTPKSRCKKGEPVFKIVKNGKWYLVFYTDKDNAKRYNVGSYIYMDVDGEEIRVSVANVEELENEARITLKCKSFFDGFLEMRTLTTKLTLASSEGLILKNESIIDYDGKKGVFVKNKLGEHVFKPVLIIATNGEKSVVYSDIYLDAEGKFVETIGNYDEIISKPSEDDLATLGAKKEKKKEDDN